MAEAIREDLLVRVRTTLVELETLSEGRPSAMRFEAKGPPRGSQQGGEDAPAPTAEGSTFNHFVDRLDRWIRDARDRLEKERYGQADEHGQLPKLSSDQARYWLLAECEGLDYRAAAQRSGLSDQQVWQIRKNNGRDPRKGLPTAA